MISITRDKPFLLYNILFLLLLGCVLQFGISRIYGPILFPDEFGYWAAAAELKGYDWSEVTSLGSYYSYGYSLLLYPVFLLAKDSVLLYRIAVYGNFVLLILGFFLLYLLMKKLFPKRESKELLLLAMSGILYSSWIFYMQLTLSEILLMSLYLLISYMFLKYLEKPKQSTAVLLAAALVYLYFVHMRTIGIAIAGVIILLLLLIFHPEYRKSVAIAAGMGILLLAGGIWLKSYMLDSLYSAAAETAIAVNDYSGQADKLRSLLTLDGLYRLFVSCIGKLFYLGISTFGLFYFGMIYIIRQAVLSVQYKFKKNLFYLFLLLSILGQFMVAAVYMMDGAYVDTVLYGRYNEIFLPIVICLGLVYMLKTKKLVRKGLALAVTQGVFAAFAVHYWEQAALAFRHGCFIVGLVFAIDRWNFDSAAFLAEALTAGTFLIGLTIVIVMLIKKNRQWYWILSILMLLQLGIGLKASQDYIYLHNSYNYRDILLGQDIKEMAEQGKQIYFLNSREDAEYIELLQFAMQENIIHLLSEEESGFLPEYSAVITYKSNERQKLFRDNYEKELESTHFYLFYND